MTPRARGAAVVGAQTLPSRSPAHPREGGAPPSGGRPGNCASAPPQGSPRPGPPWCSPLVLPSPILPFCPARPHTSSPGPEGPQLGPASLPPCGRLLGIRGPSAQPPRSLSGTHSHVPLRAQSCRLPPAGHFLVMWRREGLPLAIPRTSSPSSGPLSPCSLHTHATLCADDTPIPAPA